MQLKGKFYGCIKFDLCNCGLTNLLFYIILLILTALMIAKVNNESDKILIDSTNFYLTLEIDF